MEFWRPVEQLRSVLRGGATPLETAILAALGANRTCRVVDLAEDLDVPQQRVAAALRELERRRVIFHLGRGWWRRAGGA